MRRHLLKYVFQVAILGVALCQASGGTTPSSTDVGIIEVFVGEEQIGLGKHVKHPSPYCELPGGQTKRTVIRVLSPRGRTFTQRLSYDGRCSFTLPAGKYEVIRACGRADNARASRTVNVVAGQVTVCEFIDGIIFID